MNFLSASILVHNFLNTKGCSLFRQYTVNRNRLIRTCRDCKLWSSFLLNRIYTMGMSSDAEHNAANGNGLTLRRLMSYIYGAPILDVSRSHTTTQHSR